MKLNIKVEVDGCMPIRATEDSAGFDLVSAVNSKIEPFETKLISAGIKIELEKGYEAQIRPRSGLALKKNVTVLNSPGTIDSDFRGTVGIIMTNLGKDDFHIFQGDRIAQMVIQKVPEVELSIVNELSETDRGEGGFGSTGI